MTTPIPGKVTQLFCWLLVFSWAVALGAKVFDLLVLGCAWGASPPSSFDLLPYGKAYPVDPGKFFQPLSIFIVLCGVVALVMGWKSEARKFLLISMASFLVIWAFTPTVFWPMITELWEIHRGRLLKSDAESIALVHRWFVWDSGRILLIAAGFIFSVRALVAVLTVKPQKV